MNDTLSTRALTRDAANRMLSEHIRPSAKRIRAVIKRGSLTTIQDELNQWWIELGTPLSDASDKIPASVLELARTSWELAQLKAAEELQAHLPITAEVSARVSSAEKERDVLQQEKVKLDRTIMAAHAVTEELRQHVAYLQNLLKVAQEDVIRARQFPREQIQLADSRYSDLESHLMVQLDEERQARKTAEEQARRLRAGLAPLKPRD